MKTKFLSLFIFFFAAFSFIFYSCNNKQLFKPDYNNIAGYVIAKESCNNNELNDYWLLDFNVYQNTPHVGDTIVLNGIIYTNVLKVKGLDSRLKKMGMQVSIDYKKISNDKVITTGCAVSSPVLYPLKEIFIISQGEIR